MTALVERIVQKMAGTVSIENKMSDFVAHVLESTANKLARFETGEAPEAPPEQDVPPEPAGPIPLKSIGH